MFLQKATHRTAVYGQEPFVGYLIKPADKGLKVGVLNRALNRSARQQCKIQFNRQEMVTKGMIASLGNLKLAIELIGNHVNSFAKGVIRIGVAKDSGAGVVGNVVRKGQQRSHTAIVGIFNLLAHIFISILRRYFVDHKMNLGHAQATSHVDGNACPLKILLVRAQNNDERVSNSN